MKTIYTTLPIYDKLAKQCFERGKHAGWDKPIPILCPRQRLPSFQWLDDTDGAASVLYIEMINGSYPGAQTSPFTNWVSHIGFQLVADPDHFTHSGLNITDAQNDTGAGPDATAKTNTFSVKKGGSIRIRGTLTVTGVNPVLGVNGIYTTTLTPGAVSIDLIVQQDITTYIELYTLGATLYTFTGVTITYHDSYNITDYFVLPGTIPKAHDYFAYNGTTLQKLLPVGLWYLKITTDNGKIYYSEWFQVDCIFDNLISEWPAIWSDFGVLTTSGTEILSAITIPTAGGSCQSDIISVVTGDVFKVLFYLTLNSGQLPKVYIVESGVGARSNQVDSIAGLNDITLTATGTGNFRLTFNNATLANWSVTEVMIYKEVQNNKYLVLNYHNDCDLGDFYYHGGFMQTLWFKSEPMESTFPLEESVIKNGEGQVIRTFARQTKKYIVRTDKMPDYMVDVFNRMRLHDTITLTDLVSDTHTVYNLEVEHEWLAPDKYYAQINLTLDYDETVIIGGCCNNIT